VEVRILFVRFGVVWCEVYVTLAFGRFGSVGCGLDWAIIFLINNKIVSKTANKHCFLVKVIVYNKKKVVGLRLGIYAGVCIVMSWYNCYNCNVNSYKNNFIIRIHTGVGQLAYSLSSCLRLSSSVGKAPDL